MSSNPTRPPGSSRRRRPRPRATESLDSSPLTSVTALPPVEPPTGFAELGVPERVDAGLAAAGFAEPFKIQHAAIPIALEGRDVCGRAQTGSGKTLAFGVPMLARITDEAAPRRPLGLVLVPTRELAVQVAEVLRPVAEHTEKQVLAVYGGSSRVDQISALERGIDFVIATPLRLIDPDRRARRGRPDGRRRLHAAGRMGAAALHRADTDDAVLGDARRRRRAPHPSLPA
jgi:hypothetical protein